MKVAVLMPVYNSAAYVGQALQSLLQQRDAAELAIIVADDGSTDGSQQIVRRLAAEAPEIALTELRHGGIPHARNATLEAIPADADFVTFLDADDISPPGRLRRDLARLQADTELYYGSLRAFRELDPDTLVSLDEDEWPAVRGMQLGATLFRAEFIRRVGLFDAALATCEDLDFLLRAFELGPRYVLNDDVALLYRWREDSASRNRAQLRRDFILALSKSLKRRKSLGAFEYPPGIFDSLDINRLRGELA